MGDMSGLRPQYTLSVHICYWSVVTGHYYRAITTGAFQVIRGRDIEQNRERLKQDKALPIILGEMTPLLSCYYSAKSTNLDKLYKFINSIN